MSTVVSNYKIYCETDNKYVSGWSTSSPTTCYENNTHTVNQYSVQIMSSVSSNEVTISQKNASVNGKFHIESIYMGSCLPGELTTLIHTFDVTMSLHSLNFALNQASNGDLFSIQINPDTPLGLITSNASIGDTKINISKNILPYMHPGFYLTLTDGINTDGPYKILSFDSNANTVTLKKALTYNYLANGTQLKLNYYIIKDMPIILGTTYSFGSDIINASNAPAGTRAKFSFYNSKGDPKDVVIYLSGLI